MPAYVFRALFTASKVGVAPASAPTVDVCNAAGTLVVTDGAATALAGITGLYAYTYSGAADEYVALFKTATTTVDLQHIPSWTPTVIYTNLDAAVSTRSTVTEAQVNAQADTALADVGLTTTVTGRIDVATSTRLATSGYTAPSAAPTAAANADAVWDELIAGHATLLSTGALLSSAGAAADPLLNPVPGTYLSGTAGAALGRIGSAGVTIVSPVAAAGAIALVLGDDYLATDGRALDWTFTNVPVLTAGTIALRVQGATALTFAGTVTGAAACRVELTAAQVATIGVGVWLYDIQATLANAHVVTLVQSSILVTSDVR